MKIAFSGASSTGKTTLAKALEEKLLLKYINVDSRKIIDDLNHTNIDDLNKKEFLEFQKIWLNEKLKNEKSIEHFITDRTYIDAIAYIFNRNVDDKELFNIYLKNMEIYDFIFYLPIGRIPFTYDGYRSKDKESNKNVDNYILELFQKNEIKYHKVDISDFESSLEYILNIIGKPDE
ncbi:MAG: AAA family ATPase [Halarcobacter sp.]